MTLAQQIITVGMCVLATLLTRFLPFAVFNARKPTPQYIHYLGELLPGAIFAMLVIYCLRNVSLLSGSHGLPELIGIAVTVGLHLWKRQILLSIAGGTVCLYAAGAILIPITKEASGNLRRLFFTGTAVPRQ